LLANAKPNPDPSPSPNPNPNQAERLKGMSTAEKAAAEKAAEKARAAEAAKAAKAAAAAEADLRRPARQAQVLAEWKASVGIASYYDAGVRLSSKTGESGLGLGLTPVNTYPNLIPNQVRQVRVRVISLTLFLNQARQARRDRRRRRRRRWGGNCGTRAGRGGGLLPINWPGGPRRRCESRHERHAEAAAGPPLT